MMQSLKELYRIGRGPSSSHTMGPEAAAKLFSAEHPDADSFKAVLYGSLALTGEGHGTDRILRETLGKPTEVVWDKTTRQLPHPNTLDLYAYKDNEQIGKLTVLSVGGGAIKIVGREETSAPSPVYPLSTFHDISEYCNSEDIRLCDYVQLCEGDEIWAFLLRVWQQMKQSVEEGLQAVGVLPGGLWLQRKAKFLYEQQEHNESAETTRSRLICAYAFAVAEQNAAGGTIVTAPTCGACGVVPAVLYYHWKHCGYGEERILKALATAGIIGNVIKTNGSISGAECGCQAEIGSACAMASAALAELKEMSINQIENAAEMALEHQLGLTCDPVRGLVQVPCIERNAVSAARALTMVNLSVFLSGARKVSFDTIVETMYRTGKDLNRNYRETSVGGLAKLYPKEKRPLTGKKK